MCILCQSKQPLGIQQDLFDEPSTQTAAYAEGGAEGRGDAGAGAWAEAEVYVGTERWGRGLDLELSYVFLLAPPPSSASYAHLAGRTARKGRHGTAITLVTPNQAPRIVAFAEALGVAFEPLGAARGEAAAEDADAEGTAGWEA